ncbi:hypothetical protein ACH4GK_33740 [Streptomyces rimosus]|nr:hypothetical protein [Streptomyces rimosus]
MSATVGLRQLGDRLATSHDLAHQLLARLTDLSTGPGRRPPVRQRMQ